MIFFRSTICFLLPLLASLISLTCKSEIRYPKLNIYPQKALAGKSILFVLHDQYPPDHHNTATMFQKGEYNEYNWKRIKKNSHLVRVDYDDSGEHKNTDFLLSAPDGIIRDPSVSYDGKRALFSMRKNFEDSFKIYEIDLGSGKTRQLTHMAEVSDIDPVYLPSSEIVFASTRSPKYCGCNRHIMANLFKMDSDGSNIIQIGNSIEFENTPSVLSDGRILYTRWEYVDRNFSGAQGLWTCNPDGTRHALYWGQETKNPALQGVEHSTGRVLAILSSCHDRPWGALALIDRNIDVEGERSVIKIFPQSARALIDKKGDIYADAMRAVELKYAYPSPVGDNYVLVSKMARPKSEKLELRLLNLESGDESLLISADDPDLGVCSAKLIEARPIPPAIPEQRGYQSVVGKVYVNNVYEGTHLKGINRGDIKYLRIIENPPKTNWSMGDWDAEGTQAPAMNYDDYDNKIIYGIVPVEDDGSAYFEIPSDKFFYLQALDKDKKMLQSMRSGMVALPDEIISCVGCHESRMSSPPAALKASKALRRGPSKYAKSSYCDRLFSYAQFVQPIFDRNCMPCHDYGGKGSAKIILAGDRGIVFNKSYTELHSKKAVNAIGAGPDKVVEANAWGAKQSKIIKMIDAGHQNVELSPEEYDALCAWIDLNAPYYHTDDCAFPNNPGGRSPLSEAEIKELFKLAGKEHICSKSNGLKIDSRKYRNELVSFDRPELSEILAGMDKGSPDYSAALKIIRTGAERLNSNPRADMRGFRPSEVAQTRKAKFLKLLDEEKRKRDSISKGAKRADPKSLD